LHCKPNGESGSGSGPAAGEGSSSTIPSAAALAPGAALDLTHADLDDEFPLGDGIAQTEARVLCPVCGEPNVIGLDPGSGSRQAYVEDCQVCCRPWQVTVRYLRDGSAEVRVEPAEDSLG